MVQEAEHLRLNSPFGSIFESFENFGGINNVRNTQNTQSKASLIPLGSPVFVHSLSNMNYNNKRGKVVDNNNNRYYIKLDDGNVISIKHQNFTQLIKCKIKDAANMKTTNPLMEREPIEVIGYKPATNKYLIRKGLENCASNCASFSVPLKYLRLPDGTRCRIEGLKNAKWNGKLGTVQGFDSKEKRYKLKMENGVILGIKEDQLYL